MKDKYLIPRVIAEIGCKHEISEMEIAKQLLKVGADSGVDIAAYAFGAIWVERHFTLERTWKETDHSASLEPTGLRKLVRELKTTHKVPSFKQSDILPIAKARRDKLKYRTR